MCFTTIELIEEEVDRQRDPPAVKGHEPVPQQHGIGGEYWEKDVQEAVKAAGGIWRPRGEGLGNAL